MKRILALLLALVMAGSMITMAWADPCTGEHTWDAGVETQPTCSTAGKITYTCSACGATKEDPGAAATGQHTFTAGNVVAPTCSADGYTVYTCTCGATEKRDSVAATGAHTYTDQVTAPTCTAKGYTTHTCGVCGNSYTDTEIAAKGHTYGEWNETKATCTTPGSKSRTCSVCQSVEKVDTDPSKGHTFTETVTKPASCQAAGEKKSTCSVCSYSETSVIAQLAHKWDAGVENPKAACLTDGVKTYKCTVSGCTGSKTETLTKLGHKFSADPADGKITKEATCVEEGERTYYCQNKLADGSACTGTKKEPIEKLKEHKFDKGTVTTYPTCVKKGIKTYKCTVEKCTETKTEEIAMVNHSWDNGIITIEPTITEKGVSTHKCTVCGLTKTLDVAPLGEKMDPDELATLKAAPNNAYGAKLNVEPWVMVQGVLDEEELARVQSGWPFSVTLGVKNITGQVSDSDRQLFIDYIADEQIIVAFLDITLLKQMEGDPAQPVEVTAEMVDIVIDMPEGLPALKKNATRSYMILRLHDGVVEGVPTKLSENGEQIIFQTDKFSTYALTYSDIRQESDFPVLPIFIALMVVALAGVVYLCKLIFIDRILSGDDDEDDGDEEDDGYEEEPVPQPKRGGSRLRTEKRRRS